ncbi:hypothetical protein HBI70_143340 [Parastagonospora nodorum]|nr:hypothetical protein HBH46_160280 [Parastagonospora nodorum]KAH4413337.1 hypothetical protein HBH92_091480 [Parastagonospora nodorum]KAH4431726.1 hypothetical protein HBH93_141440 [Parastagonospora nodorum]KAH4449082.1 hypothetical protein HBH91_130930 [Parastagonospora nodorum]KAH4504594.1 hypothetical protein HBH89_091800 [Parastagonospora nodorum]
MSTSAAAPPRLNGTSNVPAEVLREADFLQHLLKIRDDVFASKHPRIHLPAKVIEQVAPRLPQTTPPSRPATNGTPNGVSASQLFPPRPDSSLQAPSTANVFVSPAPPTQRPYSAISASSSIDPVLLTKSDHLIRAELQLKRQQIERLLKDQFDKKGRGNDADERDAHLNVEECLIQAQLRVPPISGIRSTTNNSDGAESFDENSYYSSKADSWSSEENDPKHPEPLTSQAGHITHVSAQPAVIDLDEEAYEPADDIEIYEPEPATLLDDAEEEDYSPPPAEIVANEPSRGRGRNQNHNGANGSSRRHSPNGPVAPLQNPRKRRRDEKREEKKRQQQANKRSIPSPEPYIKEEPQSPPPFAAPSDSQPSKRRALQPLPNDAGSIAAQSPGRVQPVYYREPEPTSPTYHEYNEGSSPTVIRVPQRKVHRDEPDLRRVASLQYARRPFSPLGGELYAAEPRPLRSASHAFADRNEMPIYREASARPSAAPRYVRDRSRSPMHEYISRQQSPLLMAPPPRRIVVDQYGNKYYAAPVDARESVAPPTRRIEVDPYYERAVTREPTIRAPRTELYEEDTMQRMPPPPRRYVEAQGPEFIEAQPYRQREASRRPVEIEYRPQYEEMGPPREYVPSRAYSMRPEVVRREAPEGYIRHESIQPGSMRAPQPQYREVSIVRQEPIDDRRYVSAAPQARRYAEEEPVELPQEPYAPEPRRVYTRY